MTNQQRAELTQASIGSLFDPALFEASHHGLVFTSAAVCYSCGRRNQLDGPIVRPLARRIIIVENTSSSVTKVCRLSVGLQRNEAIH